MSVEVRRATLAEVRELRREVLRPHQRAEELVYDGDDAPDSLHLGAIDVGGLVAVASITREPPPGSTDADAWRIRGMATLPAFRGRGIGAELLEACVGHARSRGATLVWCNGRLAARTFYERHGFAVERDPFEITGLGPHLELRRRLDVDPPG